MCRNSDNLIILIENIPCNLNLLQKKVLALNIKVNEEKKKTKIFGLNESRHKSLGDTVSQQQYLEETL